jgi:hypothetical protein
MYDGDNIFKNERGKAHCVPDHVTSRGVLFQNRVQGPRLDRG